ncbi:hypothetical protein IF2G_10854 [Cordyceps javanica]|nr:hypothetical protein IF2G_10854 [Cordyceps javanica]
MVSGSTCEGCAICGNLPCRNRSSCNPNVPLEPAERLLLKWPKTTKTYLEDHGLSSTTRVPESNGGQKDYKSLRVRLMCHPGSKS